MPDSHVTFLTHTWKTPGFPFFLITFIYIVFVGVGECAHATVHVWRSEVSSFLPLSGPTPGFPNHQTLNLMEAVNGRPRGWVCWERCHHENMHMCSSPSCLHTSPVGGHRQHPFPTDITQRSQGSLSDEADSAAWHLILCRVLLGSLPSLEVAALLPYPVYAFITLCT